MKKVLLCRPDHFRVDYAINPWMKIGSVDNALAQTQWQSLSDAYRQLNVEVEYIDQQQQFPDMVFAADQSILVDGHTVLLSRFRYSERQGESTIYQQWYQRHGFKCTSLPEGMFFEGGGEMQRFQDYVLIGTGFRTDLSGATYVAQTLNKKLLTLELIDPKFYHLDTCLMVIDQKTAFYYPPAFSPLSIKHLAKVVPNLLPIEKSEAENFASNSVVVNQHILIQAGNPKTVAMLKELGFMPIEINVNEFIKAGGGIHCLTGELASDVT